MNKYLLIITIITLLAITACSSSQDSLTLPEAEKEALNPKGNTAPVDEEMDRYANFEAEIGCLLAEAALSEDTDALFAALEQTPLVAQEYGFSEEELTAATEKYKEDSAFLELAQAKMLNKCPEAIEAAQATQ